MATERIILRDLLYSKIPGSSKRKLTPTQLHIFEAVHGATAPRDAPLPLESSATGNDFTKGKQIRSLWRDYEEGTIKKIDQPGRRSHMHKFYIQRPDGLYKFKVEDQEKRNQWVEKLTVSFADSVDTSTDGIYPELPAVGIPSIEYYAPEYDPYAPPSSICTSTGVDAITPWLEQTKTEDGSRHFSLKRQMSTESEFARSRSTSLYSNRGGNSESGYSSGDFNHGSKSPSRSASCEKMPSFEHSPPLSPTDTVTTTKPLIETPDIGGLPSEFAEKQKENKLQLSELGKLTQDLVINLTESLKCLSPVPEESEAELNNEQDSEVVYLMKDALEYKVTHEGKTISLLEDLGIIIDVPSGAISDHHPDEVTIRINACVKGPFQLPERHELVSPVFHVEPGAKFAEKPVELSIVHFLEVEDEEACRELQFVSAPFDDSKSGVDHLEKETIKFKNLAGGIFSLGARIGKISLQHFCFIGIARERTSSGSGVSEEGSSQSGDLSIRRFPSKSRERYIAMLYYPLSFPVQPPRRYHVIFSISLSHPMYIKNLDEQLNKKFSAADSKLWRTSCKVDYAQDVIELEIPHEILQEVGYEIQTDLGCSISKENVDNIRRSRLSRSDYANYIDYPPRILMTVQQTLAHQQPSNASLGRPKLKLKGTLQESCFNLPLPVQDTASSSSLHSTPSRNVKSQLLSSSADYSPSRMDARTLVSLQKHRSLHSVPELKELGEKVTPHVHPKWYHIGIQMGLQPATLEGIELRHQIDFQRRCDEVFKEWISRSEQNPTWMTLIDILKQESIGERKLAYELERSFV